MITISIANVKSGYSINIDSVVILQEISGPSIGAKPFEAEIDFNSTGIEILVFGEKNIEMTLKNIIDICKEHHIDHQITTIQTTKISNRNHNYFLHTPLSEIGMQKLYEIVEKCCA
ncbi:hypothetical protein M2404_002171 [Rheinheimera pacifica]|uniref:hypothetical protein n=1 Tax=Rheinheimera pacifica TaxID=173990 RepID=UPI002166ED21|nr:hypothetical protein [Rheinheimera pacifica]MCS4307823.1 hypothetical protein [Rheinheimera pacifica]